jgi:two-component system NtrC family sensor kinase
VADSGMGIPKANMARIFDPFYTTKPVGKGTGLGLSICYGIVRKMGGEISVDSVLNQGTVFHIRLPLEEARA